MRKKEISKKFTLNKTTIANLNEIEMSGIYGGTTFIPLLCDTSILTLTLSNTVPQTECDCTTDTETQAMACV